MATAQNAAALERRGPSGEPSLDGALDLGASTPREARIG
jgi:hypothetical protein